MFKKKNNNNGRWPGAVLACLVPCLAFAQEAENNGIRIFEHAYFLQFDPATALDLVERTPGFNPQQQSGGRGLSGARTNVLINGERPPPKGQSFSQLLSNQPHTSVRWIELIDTGASRNVDMQGYNQVVNVVLDEERANYYELNTRYEKTGDGDPRQRDETHRRLNLTASFYWGRHEFTMRGGARDDRGVSPVEFVNIDPVNPRQRMSSRNAFDNAHANLQLSALMKLPAGKSLSVNADMNRDDRASSPLAEALQSPGVSVSESSGSDNTRHSLSAEYRAPFGGNSELMLAVLDSREEDTSSSGFVADDGDLLSSVRQRDSGETASRLLWTWQPTDQLTLRSSLSTAFNYFEGTFSRFENGQRQPLAGSDSRVEEDRHTLMLQADWSWNENWTLRGSASGGGYRIETQDLAGDIQPEYQGWASAAWQLRDRTTLTAESRYDIGQLSLSQFLASSNLSSDILQAGATSLDSERTVEHTLRYDQRFGDRGVLKFTLGNMRSLNPIRSVALSDSVIVSQNAFAESRRWFNASIEYPFERFREELVLSASFTVSDSDTVDPVSLEVRPVSWVRPFEWSLGLQKNPGEGKWSWNLELWKRFDNDDYWVRETRERWQSHEWRAFVQYEIIEGLRLSARAESERIESLLSHFYPGVRRGGLEPSYLASTDNYRDLATSLSLQWRRRNFLEVTATLNPRPAFRAEQWLHAVDGGPGTFLLREIARSPRAELQLRLYNR